jgi:hypothetical protein
MNDYSSLLAKGINTPSGSTDFAKQTDKYNKANTNNNCYHLHLIGFDVIMNFL